MNRSALYVRGFGTAFGHIGAGLPIACTFAQKYAAFPRKTIAANRARRIEEIAA